MPPHSADPGPISLAMLARRTWASDPVFKAPAKAACSSSERASAQLVRDRRGSHETICIAPSWTSGGRPKGASYFSTAILMACEWSFREMSREFTASRRAASGGCSLTCTNCVRFCFPSDRFGRGPMAAQGREYAIDKRRQAARSSRSTASPNLLQSRRSAIHYQQGGGILLTRRCGIGRRPLSFAL